MLLAVYQRIAPVALIAIIFTRIEICCMHSTGVCGFRSCTAQESSATDQTKRSNQSLLALQLCIPHTDKVYLKFLIPSPMRLHRLLNWLSVHFVICSVYHNIKFVGFPLLWTHFNCSLFKTVGWLASYNLVLSRETHVNKNVVNVCYFVHILRFIGQQKKLPLYLCLIICKQNSSLIHEILLQVVEATKSRDIWSPFAPAPAPGLSCDLWQDEIRQQ